MSQVRSISAPIHHFVEHVRPPYHDRYVRRHHGDMKSPAYHADRIFNELAAAQNGAVTRPQLLAAGVAPHTVDRRLAAGIWRTIAPAVVTAASTQPTWRMHATAALLEAHEDAVLAGRTALAMFGLDVALHPDQPPTLLVPHTKTHESAIAEVRQVKHWPSDEITTLPSTLVVPGAFLLRATSPARSLVDLSIWTPPSQWDQFERILDAAHRLRIASYHDVLRSVERARLLRRRGLRYITALLATRAGRQLLEAASELEALAHRRFARYGVGSLVEFEVPHPAYPGTSRRADGVCRLTRVIFEFDSRAFHLRDAQFAADRSRDARSAELGWITIRLTWADFTTHDAMTRARVRRMCGLDGGLRPAA